MRLVLFIVLCLFSSACNNNGNSTQRSYVITKSNETAIEAEAVTEQPAE